MSGTKPIRHAVAVVVLNGPLLLTLRRSDDEDELPGIWGLPASTSKPGETPEDVVERIGRDKLGAALRPVRTLCSGSQKRAAYRLEMDLIEATMDAGPRQGEWKWAPKLTLTEGERRGSLCCHLAARG